MAADRGQSGHPSAHLRDVSVGQTRHRHGHRKGSPLRLAVEGVQVVATEIVVSGD